MLTFEQFMFSLRKQQQVHQWRSQGGGMGQLPSAQKFIAQGFLEMMIIAHD